MAQRHVMVETVGRTNPVDPAKSVGWGLKISVDGFPVATHSGTTTFHAGQLHIITKLVTNTLQWVADDADRVIDAQKSVIGKLHANLFKHRVVIFVLGVCWAVSMVAMS